VDEPKLSKNISSILDTLVLIAKTWLIEDGGFDPFGAILNNKNEIFLVGTAVQPDNFPKGLSGNQMIRMIEDTIRASLDDFKPICAAWLSDFNLRPLEGGATVSALMGRFEETGGIAVQIAIPYRIHSDKIELGEKYIVPKHHHIIPK